jgi:ABC-type glycerol-3-phosphate transport system permease component
VNGLNTAFSKSFKRIRQFKLNVRLKKEDIINFSKAKISYYAKKIFLYLLLLNLSYVFIYPVLHMVITSFKNMQDFMDITVRWIPNRIFFENYAIALSMLDYKTGFFNSFIITVLCTFYVFVLHNLCSHLS